MLRADAKWKYIDVLADKSQLTSDPQGEYPSQTQLNKLVAVHPGVEAEASAAAAYLNNNDNVFLVEDMRGQYRVVGSDKWPTKTTVNQDLGQGTTGTTSTTINVEATDECPSPFYSGNIVADEGTIDAGANPNPATVGGNGSDSGYNGNSGGNSGNSGNSGSSTHTGDATYNNTVIINGRSIAITKGSNLTLSGNITSMKFTGNNMRYLSYKAGTDMETEIPVNNAGTVAECSDVITAPKTVRIYREEGSGDNRYDVLWFTISLTGSSSGGGNSGGSSSGNSGDVVYDDTVTVNYTTHSVADYSQYFWTSEPLTKLEITGRNMIGVKVQQNGKDVYVFDISSDKKSCKLNKNLGQGSFVVMRAFTEGVYERWFTIESSESNGD